MDFAIAVDEEYRAINGFRKVSNASRSNIFLYPSSIYEKDKVEQNANNDDTNNDNNETEMNLYSFHIVIDENFKSINIFVKNNMNKFNYSTEGNRECIVLPYRKTKDFNLFGWHENFDKNSLIYKTGKS